MTHRRHQTAAAVLSWAAVAAGASAGQPDGGILLLPPELDLGVHPPRALASAPVWIVNTGTESIELTKVGRSCGCIQDIRIKDEILAPGSALRIDIEARTPHGSGHQKEVAAAFAIRDRMPVKLPIFMETTSESLRPPPIDFEPPALDLGAIPALKPIEDVVWLTNTGRSELDVIKVISDCPCITFPEFSPFLIGPGETEQLLMEVRPPAADAGRATQREVTLFVEGLRPVVVPVRYRAAEARVIAVHEYLAGLRAADGSAAAKAAPAARVWVGARQGPGVKLAEAAPDDTAGLLGASLTYGDDRIDGRTVTLIAWSGDGDDRAPAGRLTFGLDQGNRIEWVLCEPWTARRAGVGGQGSGVGD